MMYYDYAQSQRHLVGTLEHYLNAKIRHNHKICVNGQLRSTMVVDAPDSPKKGVWTYSTVGLSTHDFTGRGLMHRPEICMASEGGERPELAGVLAYIAYHIEEEEFVPLAGLTLLDAVGSLELNGLSERLPHVFFAPPFPWHMPTPLLNLGDLKIVMSYAIPISEAEHQYKKAHGVRALEELLVREQVNIMDLERTSCIAGC